MASTPKNRILANENLILRTNALCDINLVTGCRILDKSAEIRFAVSGKPIGKKFSFKFLLACANNKYGPLINSLHRINLHKKRKMMTHWYEDKSSLWCASGAHPDVFLGSGLIKIDSLFYRVEIIS